jgi:hypothetical protein
MIASFCLCWLGIGLFMLSRPQRTSRVFPRSPGARGLMLARLGAWTALLGAAATVMRESPSALGFVTLLLGLMAALSVAVLVFPLRPRLYAASLPMVGLVAVGAWALG